MTEGYGHIHIYIYIYMNIEITYLKGEMKIKIVKNSYISSTFLTELCNTVLLCKQHPSTKQVS